MSPSSLYFTFLISPSAVSISLFSVSPSSLYSLCLSLIYLFLFDTFLVGSNRWWLGFKGGDLVVARLVLVVELNRGWVLVIVGFANGGWISGVTI